MRQTHRERRIKEQKKTFYGFPPMCLLSVADYFSYLLLCNKLTKNEMPQNSSIYYPTISVGQQLKHDLTGSSVSGYLVRL